MLELTLAQADQYKHTGATLCKCVMIYIVCDRLQVPECRTTVFTDMLAESPNAAMY